MHTMNRYKHTHDKERLSNRQTYKHADIQTKLREGERVKDNIYNMQLRVQTMKRSTLY